MLGILDPESGEIRPTRKKSGKKSAATAECRRTGMTDILSWAAGQTGIDSDLQKAFGEAAAQKIDTVARYLLATDGAPMPRIEAWQIAHPTPYGPGLSEEVYGELFRHVGQDADGQQKFFLKRAGRLAANPAIAFDSTTVSTYSRNQTEACQGFNKDRDGLNTIKLLTLYSVRDRQPIAFAKQPGNLPDVISIKNTIRQLQCFRIDKPLVVTDNGYCSQANLSEFVRNSMKFLTLVQTSVSWVRGEIDAAAEELSRLSAVCESDHRVSGVTRMRMHTFSVVRQRTRGDCEAGETEDFTRRIYVHIYFNRSNVGKDEQNLIEELLELKGLAEAGAPLSEAGQKKADRYLRCSRVGRGGRLKVAFNDEAFAQAKKYFGFFVLVTNEIKDADEALRSYREREKIEELFNVQKNSLDGKRPGTWFPDNLRGRLFCQFVALCYHCFLTKRIGEIREQLGKEEEGKTKEEQDLENSLRRWLDARSLIQILEWFDCVETTAVQTAKGKLRWSTESIKRDELFLRLLGMNR